MNSVDLNFLSVNEVETILNVIDNDFELKATEKSRLCRLRKTLNKKDQKATEVNKKIPDVSFCVICSNTFIFLLNPRRICCSCRLQICRFCCRFVNRFGNYICQICQKQKDLMAMYCSWFYKNIERKFREEGSQIVAYSLIEYLRNNSSSPEIMNMVKGTQISKFRLEIDEATRTIEESLIKVELSSSDDETKSAKYTELIQMFEEKLKQILRNTSKNLYLTMENYLFKEGHLNANIEVEVLNTMHEEVELRTGKNIDIRPCLKRISKRSNYSDDLSSQDDVETILSAPIIDKVLYDVQQSLIETGGITEDDLNSTLKSIIKKTKSEVIDLDLDSVSQVPSRSGTIRRSIRHASPKSTKVSIMKTPSMESLKSSKLYNLNEAVEKSIMVSKQWNELLTDNSPEIIDSLSMIQDVMPSPSISLHLEHGDPSDSDALSMPTVRMFQDSNWVMKARRPFGSLNSLFNEKGDSMIPRITNDMASMRSDFSLSNDYINDRGSIFSNPDNSNFIEGMYQDNRSILSDSNNTDIAEVYQRNSGIVQSKNESPFIRDSDSGSNVVQRKFSNRSSTLEPKSNNFTRQTPLRLSVTSIASSSGKNKMDLSRQSSSRTLVNAIPDRSPMSNVKNTSVDSEMKEYKSILPNRTDSQRSSNKVIPKVEKSLVDIRSLPSVGSNNSTIKSGVQRRSDSLRSNDKILKKSFVINDEPISLRCDSTTPKKEISAPSDSLRSNNRNLCKSAIISGEMNPTTTLKSDRTPFRPDLSKTQYSSSTDDDSRNKRNTSKVHSLELKVNTNKDHGIVLRSKPQVPARKSRTSTMLSIAPEVPKRKSHIPKSK